MAVTYRTSSAGGATSGTGNRTSTIAALTGDLLIVYVQWSGNSATNPTCTDNGTGTNTYTLIGTALNNASGDICALFIRDVAVAANATLTISPVVGSGTNTAGEIITIAYAGATHFGSSAIRSVSGTPQFGKQANQTSGVPTPVLPAAALTANPTLTSCGSSTTAGSVPNASWTERQDAAQATPTTSMEVATRDSGFTGTSAAYVSVASSVWNSMIIELDSSVSVSVAATGQSITSTAGTVSESGAANITLIGPTAASYAHVQGTEFGYSSATAHIVTLGANPTQGNLVIVAGIINSAANTLVSVADNNGNNYHISPSSLFASPGVNNFVLAWLIAPSNASKVITITYGTLTGGDVWADEFSGYGFILIGDSTVSLAQNVGTTFNGLTTPNGRLLYAGGGCNSGSLTNPTAGATLGVWTGSGGGGPTGGGTNTEYDLAATGPTAIQFTDSFNNDQCSGIAIAFSPGFILASVGNVAVSTSVSVAASGGSLTAAVGSAIFPNATVAATGNSVAVTAGAITESGTASVASSGQSLTSTAGTVTVSFATNVTVAAAGSSATFSVGNVTETGNANVTSQGSSTSSSVGNVTESATANVSSVGSSAAFTAGLVSTSASASKAVTGNSIASASGTVSESGTSRVAAVGSSITSTVGTVSESGTASVASIGISLTSSVGTVVVSTTVSVTVAATGISATSSTGTTTETGNATKAATGLSLTSSVGLVTESTSVSFAVTGSSATLTAGTVSDSDSANVVASGNSISASVGTVTVVVGGNINVSVTGNSFTSSAGTPTCSVGIASIINATSTLTAVLGGVGALAASVQGTSTVTGLIVALEFISASIVGSSHVTGALAGVGTISANLFGVSFVSISGIGISAAILNAIGIVQQFNNTVQSIAPTPPNTDTILNLKSLTAVSAATMTDIYFGGLSPFTINTTTGIVLRNCLFAARLAVQITPTAQTIGSLQMEYNALMGAYQQWVESIPTVVAENQS